VVSAATATAIATPSPLSTCLLFARVEALLLLAPSSLPAHLPEQSSSVQTADRRPQTAARSPYPPVLPFVRLPSLPSPLHPCTPLHPVLPLSVLRKRPRARPQWGSITLFLQLQSQFAAAIRHTPYATTLGPLRDKRCRTGRPKIHTALGVNPLSATISSSHPTFLDLVDLEVTFPGRVVAIIASLYRRRR
jgi:hypothetical protein